MPSPIVVATNQAAILSAGSNLSAQLLGAYQTKLAFSIDYMQLGRFVLLTIVTAPPNYQWQQLLERLFPMYACHYFIQFDGAGSRDLEKGRTSRQEAYQVESSSKPQLNVRNTLCKWFLDCITLGALLNTVVFLMIMGLMKGQTLESIGMIIKTETAPIILASYKIWPLASIINFSLVHVGKRIVFLSFVGLLWGMYMSLVAVEI